MNLRLPSLLICCGIVLAGAAQAARAAQPFPERPISVVVPFPPGGGPDNVARVVGEKMAADLKQPVIVDNRPGVSGMAGAAHVARSAPDGHTLLMTPMTLVIAPHVLPAGVGKQVDVIHDFEPVGQAARSELVLVARPDLGASNAGELVSLLRRKAGLSYSSSGNGSAPHIAGELFKRVAGVDMLHVPYKGVQPALSDVLGGHIALSFVPVSAALSHLQAGKLKALGLAMAQRSPLLPDVPTLGEQGFPGIEMNGWYGLFAPKGTPAAVVDRLNAALRAALADSGVERRILAAGDVPASSTVEQFSATVRADYQRFGGIIAELKIEGN